MQNFSEATDAPWYGGGDSIKSIEIEKGVTSIGNNAFAYEYALNSVIIPDSVTTIGNNAFLSSPDLWNVTIPNSVISIGSSAFANCSYLGWVVISDGVTEIGGFAFGNCKSLGSVTIPDSVTTIGDSAFDGCTKLEAINIGENNQRFKSIDGILYTKDGKELIQCPAGKTGEVVISETVTSISQSAFGSCVGLTSVTIPDGVTTISYRTFAKCSALTSVTIPDSVTTIGDRAFEDCSALTSLTIPDSVTAIGNYALWSMDNLQILFCKQGLDLGNTHASSSVNVIRYTVTDPVDNGVKTVKLIEMSSSSPTTISCSDMGTGYKISAVDATLSGKLTVLHNFPNSWVIDDEKHSRTCISCGLVEEESHTYGDYTQKKPATCQANEVESAICSVCEHEDTRSVPGTMLEHAAFKVDLNDNTITCVNCKNKFSLNSIEPPTITLTQDALTKPTFNSDSSATVTVKIGQNEYPNQSLVLTGSKLSKKVILTRTTYYLSYTDVSNDLSEFEKTTTPNKANMPKPNDPEIYTATNFDEDTFTFKLTLAKNNNIQDYQVTANNKILNGTDVGNMTYTYTVNLTEPLTLINIGCPYDANNSGKYENTNDGQYVYFHKWRNN